VAAIRTLSLLGLIGFASAGSAGQNPQNDLSLRVVRFYERQGQVTHVKAFVQIPTVLLEPAGSDPAAPMTYLMDVRVRDSSGLELVHNTWSGKVQTGARGSGATALEILEFPVKPGQYRIQVGVSDSVSGRKLASDITVEGFGAEPDLSDLLLAPSIRSADSDSTPRPGEIRSGALLVAAAAELQLTPLRTRAYYLLETYNQAADSARLAITVSGMDGKALLSTSPATTRLPAGGGVLTGALDLAGLPEGRYRLTAKVEMKGRTVERAADLSMAPLAQTIARESDRRAALRETDEGYFGEMTVERLDAAAAPLSMIAKSGELSAYDKDLSLQAKRRLLTRFWTERDPTPETPRNEVREAFYQAIAYADSNFRERGQRQVPGWKTDRGRIYTRYGQPDEVLRRQQEGYAPPYEVWRYSRGKGRFFIFADRSGFGAFKLLASNDVQEVRDPNWQRILGAPALEDIAIYLNLDRLELETGGGI
jgi:GWxTD domain-containing protein